MSVRGSVQLRSNNNNNSNATSISNINDPLSSNSIVVGTTNHNPTNMMFCESQLPSMLSFPVFSPVRGYNLVPALPAQASRDSSPCSSDAESPEDVVQVRLPAMEHAFAVSNAGSSLVSVARRTDKPALPVMIVCNEAAGEDAMPPAGVSNSSAFCPLDLVRTRQELPSLATSGSSGVAVAATTNTDVVERGDAQRCRADSDANKSRDSRSCCSSSGAGVLQLASWRHPTVYRCLDSSQDKLAISFERFRTAKPK